MTGDRFVGVSNNEHLSGRARQLTEESDMADQVHFHITGDTDDKTLGAFPDNSFDAIFFYESVCHLPDKERFFDAA